MELTGDLVAEVAGEVVSGGGEGAGRGWGQEGRGEHVGERSNQNHFLNGPNITQNAKIISSKTAPILNNLI